MFAFKPFGSSLFEIQIMPYSSLAPSFLSYFNPTYFISIMAHLYSLFYLYIPYGNFNFTLVLVIKFPGSLNLSFHNLSIHQFSQKDLSLAQFIPRIYNKIIIKILGYFWGVTGELYQDTNLSQYQSPDKNMDKNDLLRPYYNILHNIYIQLYPIVSRVQILLLYNTYIKIREF